MQRRRMIVGNWKMNLPTDPEAAVDIIAEAAVSKIAGDPALIVCPPATMIALLAGRGIRVGGQDCHVAPAGPHTGDISAPMLVQAGATHVILGHSERRATHNETDEVVAMKAKAAWKADLTAIICVGETKIQREGGAAISAVATQLVGSIPKGAKAANTVIAYEPIWAIGSGRAASLPEIAEMHAAIRAEVARRFGAGVAANIRILYGGSMDASNAAGILALDDVDGGLIGGASLKTGEFLTIARMS